MTQYQLIKTSELSAANSVYLLQGIPGSIPESGTFNLDWQFPEERWVTGASFFVENPAWGDSVSLQLVLKGEQEVVLGTFVKDYGCCSDSQEQLKVELNAITLTPAGVYLRIVYKRVAPSTTNIVLNLFTYIPLDEFVTTN